MEFTPEQEMLRAAVREFAEAEVAPHVSLWDEEDCCPVEIFPKLGEMGICGIFVPEEYGGAGLSHVERMICVEEISRYSAGLGIALITHHLGIYAILIGGTDEQKRKYLPELCSGTKISGLAVTEPTGGSDFIGQTTQAERRDTGWLLNGRKCFITNSHIADVTVVSAVSGKDEKGRNSLSTFIIEKGTPGFEPGRKENKLGLRGSVTGELVLKDVSLAGDALLGKEGKGGRIAMESISEVSRAGMTGICIGILRGCVEDSVKFAKERIVYGQPISKLQAIQFEISQIRMAYETAKLIGYRAAEIKDLGKTSAPFFAMAKYTATENAVSASKRLMDLMGGYGIINEYDAGRYLRDALASIPAAGTSHIQQVIIAADTISNFKA